MKILTVIGARPQFIKAATLSRALAVHNSSSSSRNISEVIVHTGQHYDANMSDVFFQEMEIPASDYNLAIGGDSHGLMTGRMLEKVEEVILSERPDIVLVYGDTNSTLAGALSAAKVHVPVAHVEAGLRSFNMRMPEEINRVLTDRLSQWLFCPTETAVQNLAREGIPREDNPKPQRVIHVGDVMYDAALHYRKVARPSRSIRSLCDSLNDGFYLATVHRAENTDDPKRLAAIMKAFEAIAENTPVILPLHPRTRKKVDELDIGHSRITLIEPVGYFDMLILLDRCTAVITDSGGLQKEAFFFRKPCVTLRDETEWVELVKGGYNILSGADPDRIVESVNLQCNQPIDWNKQLYGDGKAAEKILSSFLEG